MKEKTVSMERQGEQNVTYSNSDFERWRVVKRSHSACDARFIPICIRAVNAPVSASQPREDLLCEGLSLSAVTVWQARCLVFHCHSSTSV